MARWPVDRRMGS